MNTTLCLTTLEFRGLSGEYGSAIDLLIYRVLAIYLYM